LISHCINCILTSLLTGATPPADGGCLFFDLAALIVRAAVKMLTAGGAPTMAMLSIRRQTVSMRVAGSTISVKRTPKRSPTMTISPFGDHRSIRKDIKRVTSQPVELDDRTFIQAKQITNFYFCLTDLDSQLHLDAFKKPHIFGTYPFSQCRVNHGGIFAGASFCFFSHGSVLSFKSAVSAHITASAANLSGVKQG
jgi:hypothetical protein